MRPGGRQGYGIPARVLQDEPRGGACDPPLLRSFVAGPMQNSGVEREGEGRNEKGKGFLTKPCWGRGGCFNFRVFRVFYLGEDTLF